jgi:hypothetical protein
MSKNLTRKGIAFGAIVALGTTLFAGTPAQAAQVSMAPSAGTGNATILGENFTVKATIDSLVPASAFKTLKFKVTNSSEAALTYVADTHSLSSNTTGKVDAANGTTSTGTSDVVYESSDAAAESTRATGTLAIKTSATVATTVSVVAFLDADGGDDLDAGEYQTAAYEIKFVKAADAGITTVLTQPQIGDATVGASVTSAVINVGQIAAGNLTLHYGKYTSASGIAAITAATPATFGELTAGASAGEDTALDADTEASHDDSTAIDYGTDSDLIAAGSYTVQALWSPTPASVDYVKVGAASTKSASAATVTVSGTDKTVAVITANENVTSAGVVRKDYTGDVVLTVTVKDTDKKVIAGKVVRLVTDLSDSTGTFKINGKAVSATADATFEATSDSSGVAKFVVTSSTAAESSVLDVLSLTSDGVSILPTLPGSALAFTWDAATYTAVHKDGEATTRAVASGSTYNLSVLVVDQWKKPLTNAAYRFKADVTGRAVTSYYGDLAAGVATFAIADGGLASDTATVTFSAWQQNKSTGWTATSPDIATPGTPGTLTLNYYSQTDVVALEKNTVNNADLSARAALKKTVAVDTRLSNTAATSLVTSGTNGDEQVNITGTVKNSSTGVLKAGALVTVSGDSSILFNVGNVYAFGSLTFFDADGTLAINAYSNKVQTDSVVTVASGSVSATTKISFTGGPTDLGTAIEISAPSYVQAGGTLQVSVKVVDQFGNGVDTDIDATDWDDSNSGTAGTVADGEQDAPFEVSYSGPGIIFGAGLPTATGSDGVAKISALLGTTDTGTIIVTAKYAGADGVLGGSSTDDVTATKSIVVGKAATAPGSATVAISASTGKFYTSVTNAAGKKVVVKVAGKFVKSFTGTAAKKTLVTKTTKGSKKVTVFVGGKLVATKTINVR